MLESGVLPLVVLVEVETEAEELERLVLAAVQLKQQRFHHVLLKRKYNYKMAP
jgi:hypothetical protein